MKCDLCQKKYDPKKIIPIPIYTNSGETCGISIATMSDGTALNLCQSCLASTIWMECRDPDTDINLFISHED